jgi:hypothetical protein
MMTPFFTCLSLPPVRGKDRLVAVNAQPIISSRILPDFTDGSMMEALPMPDAASHPTASKYQAPATPQQNRRAVE